MSDVIRFGWFRKILVACRNFLSKTNDYILDDDWVRITGGGKRFGRLSLISRTIEGGYSHGPRAILDVSSTSKSWPIVFTDSILLCCHSGIVAYRTLSLRVCELSCSQRPAPRSLCGRVS